MRSCNKIIQCVTLFFMESTPILKYGLKEVRWSVVLKILILLCSELELWKSLALQIQFTVKKCRPKHQCCTTQQLIIVTNINILL